MYTTMPISGQTYLDCPDQQPATCFQIQVLLHHNHHHHAGVSAIFGQIFERPPGRGLGDQLDRHKPDQVWSLILCGFFSKTDAVKHETWCLVPQQGLFLSVLPKIQYPKNAKTQFENAKTQLENPKTQLGNR